MIRTIVLLNILHRAFWPVPASDVETQNERPDYL
jgi:hypothetical protein